MWFGGVANNQYGTLNITLTGGSSYEDTIINQTKDSGNAFNGAMVSISDTNSYSNVRYIKASVKSNLGTLINATAVLTVQYK